MLAAPGVGPHLEPDHGRQHGDERRQRNEVQGQQGVAEEHRQQGRLEQEEQLGIEGDGQDEQGEVPDMIGAPGRPRIDGGGAALFRQCFFWWRLLRKWRLESIPGNAPDGNGVRGRRAIRLRQRHRPEVAGVYPDVELPRQRLQATVAVAVELERAAVLAIPGP